MGRAVNVLIVDLIACHGEPGECADDPLGAKAHLDGAIIVKHGRAGCKSAGLDARKGERMSLRNSRLRLRSSRDD